MTRSYETTGQSAWCWSLLFCGLLAFLGARLLTMHVSMLNVDEASYAAAAVRTLTEHAPLMAEVRDNKPPGIHAVYATVFSVFGPYRMTALRWVGMAWVALTAALIALFARRWGGRTFAVCAAAFYLMATSLDLRLMAVKTEMLANLPVALALGALVEAVRLRSSIWAATAGGAVVLCFVFRQPTVLIPMGAGLLLLVSCLSCSEPSWRQTVVRLTSFYCVGLACSIAAFWAVFQLLGSWPAALLQSVRLPLDFPASAQYSLTARAIRLATYLEEYFRFAQVIFLSALLGCGAMARGLWRGRDPAASSLNWAMAGAVPAAVLAFASAPEQYHSYFLQLYVPFAICFGWLCSRLVKFEADTAGGSSASSLWRAMLVAAFASGLVLALKEPVKISTGRQATADAWLPRLTGALRSGAVPGDRLLVWGYKPSLYLSSGLVPATRFTLTDVLVGASGEVGRTLDAALPHRYYESGAWDVFMHQLEVERPRYIVDAKRLANIPGEFSLQTFPRIAAYVAKHYRQRDEEGDLVLYERLPQTRLEGEP